MYAIVQAPVVARRRSPSATSSLIDKIGQAGDEIAAASRSCSSTVDTVTRTRALAKVTVTAEIVGPSKGPKIDILKYKNKTGYRKRQGHRQPLTQVKITGIDA